MRDRHRYTLRSHCKMASSSKRARVPTPPGTTTMSGFGTYVSIPITSKPMNHSNSCAHKIHSSFHLFFSHSEYRDFAKTKQVCQYVYLPGQKRQWLGRWACRDQCKVPHYGSQRLPSRWANNSAPRKDPRNPMLSSPWRWAWPPVESSPSPFSQLWNSCKNLKLFSLARPDLCWRKSRSLLGILWWYLFFRHHDTVMTIIHRKKFSQIWR